MSKPQLAYQLGVMVEQKVKRYLIQQGLHFITANYRAKCGEIDLIMRDGACWVFVEVKYRSAQSHGSAMEMFTQQKRRKVIKTMYVFMAKHALNPHHVAHRVDLVAIDGTRAKWHKGV
ncbi:MAG: YraN family protein [Glaciecola sp.]|nr:YraN family protein [Glaciecola sp.]MDG1815850.1 YraN family protein [Glaciecola sp.]MDG2100062.1 YraN family protein [Glaciecola sp.]